jgi:ParB/RepB/Spo0J family partition protein
LQREDFIDFALIILLTFLRMKEEQGIEEIAISGIGERYGVLRIVSPLADAVMLKSIQRYGQISPVVCAKTAGGYELIDGFKRLRASRRLNKATLRARTMEVSARACKAAIIQLNRVGRSANEMEEALVIQSLHREDGLQQTEIAGLLGRHKSWVSRRIALIERLSEEVQEDIRLGLISMSVGRELRKLPRCNQQEALSAVRKHRLNKRDVGKLISHLLSRPRWEYQTILSSPWEIIEPKQSGPVGLEAKLISFKHICQSLSEGVKKSRLKNRSYLYEPIERAIGAAEEVVQTLRAAR